jgi:16S rRNA (cytosine1402-N4)-methyltransferase
MRDELVALLSPRPGGTYVDLTTGAGGHLEAVLLASAPDGHAIGIDRDRDAISLATTRLARFAARVTLIHGNASDVATLVDVSCGQPNSRVDGVILDAGVSSMQLDRPERGFSFLRDGPLDMRMDQTTGQTAADVVNGLPEADLAAMIHEFGEERYARRIARAIVSRRRLRVISTTADLASVIARAVPSGHGLASSIHPATRTFQAVRIAVNREMDALGAAIPAAINIVRPGGRVVVIAFHSLEDRIVKRAFQVGAGKCTCPPQLPVCICGAQAVVRVLTARPLVPTDVEIAANPRSRSARMRAVEVLKIA